MSRRLCNIGAFDEAIFHFSHIGLMFSWSNITILTDMWKFSLQFLKNRHTYPPSNEEIADFWGFVYKDQLLGCCSKSKSSNTQLFCGLDFSHALNLNFIKQTLEFIDRRYLACIIHKNWKNIYKCKNINVLLLMSTIFLFLSIFFACANFWASVALRKPRSRVCWESLYYIS